MSENGPGKPRLKSKKNRIIWMFDPPKPPRAVLTEDIKAQVEAAANGLIEEWKPKYIHPPSTNNDYNYITELSTKWFRSWFYFCAKYACPSPNAISPSFEIRFVRLEYVGKDKFNLAYMRHTGQWADTSQGITLDQWVKLLRTEILYQP